MIWLLITILVGQPFAPRTTPTPTRTIEDDEQACRDMAAAYYAPAAAHTVVAKCRRKVEAAWLAKVRADADLEETRRGMR